jgi:uncharacterized protein (DUF488 family)
MGTAMARLFSFGHSTKALDDFVHLIRDAGIDVVYDIRRRPHSRWNPQFNRAALDRELAARGFDYRWAGDDLGGFRDEGYAQWMRDDRFKHALDKLVDAAQTKTVGFMCSEGQPWKCHRRFVSRALSERGHEVLHLLPDGTTVPEDSQLALPDL